ncbi:MAG: hypothetical protein GY696_36595, partial [Gammaproteobacteria bacterium]|nr:hypothetical protein [Gammaproteobacteria bacterium]
MAEGGREGEMLQGARTEWEEATPPGGEDVFRRSTTTRRSPSVANRLEQTAGKQPVPIVHELGRNRTDGVTPEPSFEGERTGTNDLITPAQPIRPVPMNRNIPPQKSVGQPADGVREDEFLGNPLLSRQNQFLGESLPGLDLRSGGHGARPKTTGPFGSRVGQSRQPSTAFNPGVSFPARNPSAAEASMQ